MCQVFKFFDPTGHGPDLDVPGSVDFAYLYEQVTAWQRLTEQGLVVLSGIGTECRWQTAVIANRTTDDLAHTGTAFTIAAPVGQYNALAQRSFENRFGRLDAERMSAGLYGDLVRHAVRKLYRMGEALSPI